MKFCSFSNGKSQQIATSTDPELGRFCQPDTIIPQPYNPQTLNRYSYCDNNPLNYTDPTGHGTWKNFTKWVDRTMAKFSRWCDKNGIDFNYSYEHTESWGPGGNGGSGGGGSSSGGGGNSSSESSSDTSDYYDESGFYNPVFSQTPESFSEPVAPIYSGSSSIDSYDPLEVPALSYYSSGMLHDLSQTNPVAAAIKAHDLQRAIDLKGPFEIMQQGISAGLTAAEENATQWINTIKGNPHTSRWTTGIKHYTKIQNGVQVAGIGMQLIEYKTIYDKALSQNLSGNQIWGTTMIHTAGYGVVGLTALVLVPEGAILAAVVVGALASAGVKWAEDKLDNQMGIK